MDLAGTFAASNAAGIEFVKTELGLGHTFLDVAETTKQPEQRLRCMGDAQKAYRTVMHFLPRLQVTPEQKLDLDREIAGLKERLMVAGVEL